MEENYSKDLPNKNTEGPSVLTIKRILAFSKAMNTFSSEKEIDNTKKL
ncbi:MAG: hypothetical protein P8M60_00055 [Flavobacteriaceae bacterium]|jgi:hypothetical protein|nr:hypothetical protein [Flavobacteriaceae bacterium]